MVWCGGVEVCMVWCGGVEVCMVGYGGVQVYMYMVCGSVSACVHLLHVHVDVMGWEAKR